MALRLGLGVDGELEIGKERDLIFGEHEGMRAPVFVEKIQNLLGENPSQPMAPKLWKDIETGQPGVQAGMTRKIIQDQADGSQEDA